MFPFALLVLLLTLLMYLTPLIFAPTFLSIFCLTLQIFYAFKSSSAAFVPRLKLGFWGALWAAVFASAIEFCGASGLAWEPFRGSGAAAIPSSGGEMHDFC